METKDQVDGRTFRVNFSVEGVKKLRERVMEKLKEFMGDYTDDTLVEYVIVLLRNGRRKEESKSELDVFLGDDSESFVNWLWDHLALNIEQYVEAPESSFGKTSKSEPTPGDHAGHDPIQHFDSESDKRKASRPSKSRHKRMWKGSTKDESQPLIHSIATDDAPSGGKVHLNVNYKRRSASPGIRVQKKRSRADEHALPKMAMNASRRLLQFAVRDAVALNRPSSTSSEPAAKRLRSVVSTCTSDSAEEHHPPRRKPVARQPNAMAAAIKAVAEAAQDVVRSKSSTRNVFDRLSCGTVALENIEQVPIARERAIDVEQFEGCYQPQDKIHQVGHRQPLSLVEDQPVDYYQSKVQDDQVDYYQPTAENKQENYYTDPLGKQRQMYVQQKKNGDEQLENKIMMQSNTGLASGSASDNEGSDNVNVMGHGPTDISQIGSSSGERRRDNLLMVQYSVAEDAGMATRHGRMKDSNLDSSAYNSRKVLNISINVNTRKPPHYQLPHNATELDAQRFPQRTEVGANQSRTRLMKENNNLPGSNGNGKPAVGMFNETLKTEASGLGSYSTGRPLEDVDLRTIFVNNVHFGATKDSLSRHFNQCGEVLKVIMLTDAATGQPRGSAYVEFLHKEAAKNALSLDGSYFMSRMIKVLPKSSAPQDASPPIMTWPRVFRGGGRYPRVPFPRGSYRPSAYMVARPPLKLTGARNMQWKRDAQVTADPSAAHNVNSGAGRGLTYVRTESKVTTNSNTAS